jgi:hypothetical protein
LRRWQRCGLLGCLASICHVSILCLLLLHSGPPLLLQQLLLLLQQLLLKQQLSIHTAPEARHAAHRSNLVAALEGSPSCCLHAAHGSRRRQGPRMQQRLTSQQGLQMGRQMGGTGCGAWGELMS